MKNLLTLLIVTLTIISAKGQTYNVTTLAGSTNGYANGTGTEAKFTNPDGVCLDANGNLIITDRTNHLIRKVTPAGVVTTIAGTTAVSGASEVGVSGWADGKPGKFNVPWQSAVDAAGNIIVVEKDGARIRKIASDGTVSTIAGTGTAGFLDGAANVAQFKSALAPVVDSKGNIFIVDRDNRRIRKLATDGQVSTFAGDGTTSILVSPLSITIDANDNLYIGDDKKIKKITNKGVITTIAGSISDFDNGQAGLPLTAKFSDVYALCFDNEGNLIIADSAPNHRIRKITPGANNDWTTATVTTIAGTGTVGKNNGLGTVATFNNPYGIAVTAEGIIYVAEASNHLIRKITPSTLPIRLGSFTAQKEFSNVRLQWNTLSERDNYRFEILKSTNGDEFTSLGYVMAKGNSNSRINYSFTDKSPANGSNYYQLKQFDIDGSETLLGTQAISFNMQNKSALTIFNNYAQDNFTVNIVLDEPTEATIKIIDMQGNVLYNANKKLNSGSSSFEIPIQLKKGTHVLSLQSPKESISTKFLN